MKTWEQLKDVIECPYTREPLHLAGEQRLTTPSGHGYAMVKGVPVLRSGPEAQVMNPEHVSNAVGAEIKKMMLECPGKVLFLGAGASDFRAPHVYELEYNLFRDTDVIGDAHSLPFKSGVFELVVALNVFEHLREPHLAAAEILRVLSRGGKVFIHTAFLQPLHEAPHHYYGATEFGVRQWFTNFTDVEIRVSGNFHPYIGYSWGMSELLWQVESHLGKDARHKVEEMTIGQLAQFWITRQHGEAAAWNILSQLPEQVQRRCAAGFELKGTRP